MSEHNTERRNERRLGFESKVVESLSRLETQMETLVGNGQPGIITKQEERIAALEQFKAKAIGYGAAIAFVVSMLVKLGAALIGH